MVIHKEYHMQKIYQNFDGLDMTFQCAIPRYILNKLELAQNQAVETRKGVIITIGKSQIPVEVAHNGMRGGYTYRFDTGLDGAIWAIANQESPEQYNVKVSVKSLCLALHGYQATKERILDFLINELNAIAPENQNAPLERISRIDYCFDFLMDNNFVPDPKCFLTHNKCKKSYQGDIPNLSPLDFICLEQGKEIQTITIGKMPNRQITIYNKAQEIKDKQKIYWWDIWGINPKENNPNIWRVEVRAGKKELNKYQLRRFGNFEKKVGDVIINILKDYRYVIPNENDTNRNRWPLAAFWQICVDSTNQCLAEYMCGAERSNIIQGHQEMIVNRYRDHLKGMFTNYTAAKGFDISELPTVLEGFYEDILESVNKNPQKFRKNHKKAEMKFEFLHGKKTNELLA